MPNQAPSLFFARSSIGNPGKVELYSAKPYLVSSDTVGECFVSKKVSDFLGYFCLEPFEAHVKFLNSQTGEEIRLICGQCFKVANRIEIRVEVIPDEEAHA